MSNQKGVVRMAKAALVWGLNHTAALINHTFYNRTGSSVLKEHTAKLPHSNGSRYYNRLPVTVGIVADAFVLHNYEPTCNLLPLTPDGWKAQLGLVDCLLVTSVWRGRSGEWTGASHADSAKRRELLAMMCDAKSRQIPVVFYSKEDPPNYDVFLDFAKEADYIFTSARECIPRYQAVCPNAKVDVLTFATNPLIHNPIGSEGEKISNAVFFAGSWMAKYPARIETMGRMFRLFLDAGLNLYIADRNFSRQDFRYVYPLRYLRYVLGDFSYEQIAEMYKVYPWCMNINSVTDSDTMFAMRVYDALASGAQVLSNKSQGVQQMFPEVHIINTEEDLRAVLSLSQDALKENKARSIRTALRHGTVFDKMAYILQQTGMVCAAGKAPTVGVLLPTDLSETEKTRLTVMFDAQTYPHKKLIVSDSSTASDCDMLCLWGAGREYGQYYLEDMINGFKFTDCDYITKHPDALSEAHTYTDRITDRYATVFWATAITAEQLASLPDAEICFPNGYASDRENYAVHPINGE